jgi:starch-binding outer membrane protein, SusD/RagB family
MKKLILLIIVAASFFVTSCNNDDLNLEPKDAIVSSAFFKTTSDATSAITGVYASLTYWPDGISYYGCMHNYMADVAADYMTAGTHNSWPALTALGTKQITPTNEYIYSAWCQTYSGINRANVAIDNIPKVTGDSALKVRLINEAKFIRAVFYFNAVRFWGPVPLVLHEPVSVKNNVPFRTPVDSIYAQIIRDLKDATNLPSSYVGDNLGRATSGAAKALLSSVYLTLEDWTNAIKYAQEVKNGGYGYELNSVFYDNFDPKKKFGKESIFTGNFELGQNGSTGSGSVLIHCYWSNGFSNSATPFITLSDLKFYELYSSKDQRRDISMAKTMYNPKTNSVFVFTIPRLRKFIDTTIVLSSTSKATPNYPVIRYAGVLLQLAEAINEKSGPNAEAYEAINQIRRRAFKYDITKPGSPVDLPAGLSKEQFRDTVRLERFKELTQEGTRWFDLVRWKIYVKSITATPYKGATPIINYLFPIPQAERDVNPNITQNWGFDGATGPSPYDESYK